MERRFVNLMGAVGVVALTAACRYYPDAFISNSLAAEASPPPSPSRISPTPTEMAVVTIGPVTRTGHNPFIESIPTVDIPATVEARRQGTMQAKERSFTLALTATARPTHAPFRGPTSTGSKQYSTSNSR